MLKTVHHPKILVSFAYQHQYPKNPQRNTSSTVTNTTASCASEIIGRHVGRYRDITQY